MLCLYNKITEKGIVLIMYCPGNSDYVPELWSIFIILYGILHFDHLGEVQICAEMSHFFCEWK